MGDAADLEIAIVSHGAEELLRRCLRSLAEHPAAVRDPGDGDRQRQPRLNPRDGRPRVSLGACSFAARTSASPPPTISSCARPRHPSCCCSTPTPRSSPGPSTLSLSGFAPTRRSGWSGAKLITETGELDHACKRSFPTPLGALAHFSGIGRGALAWQRAQPVPRHPPRRGRARRGRRRQRRLHALPGRGNRRGRPARRGLLALHGGPRLVPPLLEAGWKVFYEPAALALHVKGGSAGAPPPGPTGDRISPRDGPLLPPFDAPEHNPRSTLAVYPGIGAKLGASLALTALRGRGEN